MAGTTTHPTAFRQTVADLVDSTLNVGGPGLLQFRTAGTANSLGTVVATLTFSATAFGAADGAATITANSITSDTNATGNAAAVETATFALANGTTVIVHTTVGSSGNAINLGGGLTIGAGDTVSCSSLTYTAMP